LAKRCPQVICEV